MGSANGEMSAEQLKAQAHIWNQLFSFINSYSLKCAVQLGIPDIIHDHGKPMTLNELVQAVPIHPSKTSHVYRLMRILVHSGFFKKQKLGTKGEDEGYVLTAASSLLLKNEPFSVAPFLLAMFNPILITPWDYVATWFQNDDPTPFQTAHGISFWEIIGQQPSPNNFFSEAMASDARFITAIFIDRRRDVFEGLSSLVDVGGGTGTVAKAIASAFPELQCFNFDLPYVVDGLQDRKNLRHVGGDMFEVIPPADAILLKWVLHDWNDDDCIKILKNCKEALSRNKSNKIGKVMIIDMVLDDDKRNDDDQESSRETELFFDMVMMSIPGGRERNEKEWVKLFKSAGFSGHKVTRVFGLRCLIEVFV